MGKASSSKKVARAAGTGGGRTNRGSTPWTFVGLIGLIVVVGVALTFTSRNRAHQETKAASNANASVAPTVGGTAWEEGFGVYICDAFVPAIKAPSNKEGLTTNANGIIHIAPKVKAAAGKNATLGAFAQAIGMTLSGSEIQVPGGKKYSNGDDCSGQASKVYIKQFPYIGAPGAIVTQDPPSIRLADKALVTIAFVPAADKSKIPAPPAYVSANLKKAEAPTTTTTAPTTTTIPKTTTTTPKTTGTTAPKTATTSKTTTTTRSASTTAHSS
jgi:hypothetical protein